MLENAHKYFRCLKQATKIQFKIISSILYINFRINEKDTLCKVFFGGGIFKGVFEILQCDIFI